MPWRSSLTPRTNRNHQDLNDSTLMSGQRNFSDQQQQLQQRQASDAQQEAQVRAASQSAEQPPLEQMSALDRFGLSGLLRMIHSESPDVASLAVGQDLMTLGLDLNQPESVFPLCIVDRLELMCHADLSIRPLPRRLCRLCLRSLWSKISPCHLVTMLRISNLCSHASLDLVMKRFSTFSTPCLVISCRSWSQRS